MASGLGSSKSNPISLPARVKPTSLSLVIEYCRFHLAHRSYQVRCDCLNLIVGMRFLFFRPDVKSCVLFRSVRCVVRIMHYRVIYFPTLEKEIEWGYGKFIFERLLNVQYTSNALYYDATLEYNSVYGKVI